MSTVYQGLSGLSIQDSSDIYTGSHWDGYFPNPVPQAFLQGTPNASNQNWGGVILAVPTGLNNIPYIGYDTNFTAMVEPIFVPFKNIPYIGFTTNFAGTQYNNVLSVPNVDLDSVIGNPKPKLIYYKLKGYNPLTQLYETWIEIEDITSRPEQFNPGNHFPTRERDVYQFAPSNDALVNIVIVGRWIQ
jgi:hypothetical protein